MDLELIFWVFFFIGGYSILLGYLLRIALTGKGSKKIGH